MENKRKKEQGIDNGLRLWDNDPVMKHTPPLPITDLLRETIIASKIPHLTLEQDTGVQRASIRRFIRGERSLRLDIADKLAAYFGLALRPVRKKEKRK